MTFFEWLQYTYCRIWYASEFWLTPVDRRPWTFIMRDFIFGQPQWAVPMIVAWYVGMGFLFRVCPIASAVLSGTSGFVLAHVVWGSKWIEGEQEHPPYIEEGDE